MRCKNNRLPPRRSPNSYAIKYQRPTKCICWWAADSTVSQTVNHSRRTEEVMPPSGSNSPTSIARAKRQKGMERDRCPLPLLILCSSQKFLLFVLWPVWWYNDSNQLCLSCTFLLWDTALKKRAWMIVCELTLTATANFLDHCFRQSDENMFLDNWTEIIVNTHD